MDQAYINNIATAVPDFDVHSKFIEYCPRLLPDERSVKLFQRMAERSQIEHRYSFLQPHADVDKLDVEGFYQNDAFPSTQRGCNCTNAVRSPWRDTLSDPNAKALVLNLELCTLHFKSEGTLEEIFAFPVDVEIIIKEQPAQCCDKGGDQYTKNIH